MVFRTINEGCYLWVFKNYNEYYEHEYPPSRNELNYKKKIISFVATSRLRRRPYELFRATSAKQLFKQSFSLKTDRDRRGTILNDFFFLLIFFFVSFTVAFKLVRRQIVDRNVHDSGGTGAPGTAGYQPVFFYPFGEPSQVTVAVEWVHLQIAETNNA